LMLDKVLHKTWIELDEDKTEAAAATAIVMRITGNGQPSYKIFKADHPFVFFIIDNKTRAILFMGRFVEPVNGERISEDDKNLTLNLESRKQENFSTGSDNQKILYVIDNKIISEDEIHKISPDNIESLKVIKDKEEIRYYSPENYNGAIVITLKKKKNKK
jgi:serpin B